MQTNLGKITPLELFQKIPQNTEGLCFLNSNSDGGWEPFLSFGKRREFVYKIDFTEANYKKNLEEKLTNFLDFVEANAKEKFQTVGFFSYDLGACLEGVKLVSKDETKTPDICFFGYPNWCDWNDQGELTVHYQDEDFLQKVKSFVGSKNSEKTVPTSPNFLPKITQEEYQQAFEEIKNQIVQGNLYQINLTYQNQAMSDIDGKILFELINQKHKVNYLAYLQADGFEIISASPENFVKIKGGTITTQPIKGTIKRGKDEAEDTKNIAKLLANPKEIAELDMITDLLRNDIGKVSELGTVELKQKRSVLKTPSVIHTFSTIEGELSEKENPIKAVLQMLPAGSIIGCPKHEAVKIVDKVESERRGAYTGVFGIIKPNFEMDFSVIIRTIVKTKNQLNFGVGGGIVYDSQVDSEWQETINKSKII